MIYSTTPGTLKISAVENKLNGTVAVSVCDSDSGICLGAGGEEADAGQRRQGRGEKRTGQRDNLCCYLAGGVGIHQEELI